MDSGFKYFEHNSPGELQSRAFEPGGEGALRRLLQQLLSTSPRVLRTKSHMEALWAALLSPHLLFVKVYRALLI